MDSQIVQFQNYLHILYCRRYLFVLVAVTTALILVVGCFFIPKRYEAKSTVFIEKNVVNALMKGLTITPSMNDRIRVLRYQMLSRDMVSRVLKKLNMDVKVNNSDKFERLIKRCQEGTKIHQKGKDLFFVSFIDSDPYFAKDYINTLVNTYVEENIALKRNESYGAGRFLTEQIKFYKQKIDKIEDAINKQRKKTGIFTTVSEQSIVKEIKEYKQEIKSLMFDKNELLATVKTIRGQLQSMKTMAASGQITAQMYGKENVQKRIAEIRNKLQELLMKYNDKYPTVVKLKEQLVDLEANRHKQAEAVKIPVDHSTNSANFIEDPIFVDLKMRLNVAQADLNALLAREKELRGQINSNRKLLEKFPQEKKILADMEQERDANKKVYESLLGRLGIAEVSKQMEVADKSSTFRIVDPAILPISPVGTKRLVKMILSVIAGIGLGIGAVVAREKLDDTVKDADTIRALGGTVLAEIPFIYTEEENKLVRKRDRLVYLYASMCLICICALLVHDLLGMTVFDRMLASTQLDTVLVKAFESLH